MLAAIRLDHLAWIPDVALVAALTAWSAAFAGMLDQVRRRGTNAHR
jgi:hypothetical protein